MSFDPTTTSKTELVAEIVRLRELLKWWDEWLQQGEQTTKPECYECYVCGYQWTGAVKCGQCAADDYHVIIVGYTAEIVKLKELLKRWGGLGFDLCDEDPNGEAWKSSRLKQLVKDTEEAVK